MSKRTLPADRQRGRDEQTDRRTVRFDESTTERLDALVADGEYVNFSDAVRELVNQRLQETDYE
ncbi:MULTISPECIES: ribbon-helix-helix domain-containing protein [Halorussus]|uniref:ribbon-helix-helix domain-containing protein n=1 Tax=Halorussus TaxID=1070314 RepID=UPI00209E79A2|nr:ribbon-helix-helix domain-containing protein [Halorussus vallis]USZ78718.1 ribbon-helix-helix domain-containing protein [Halorussus vallis]